MASAKDDGGCFTLTWEIANFGLLLEVAEEERLRSPAWKVEHTVGSAWWRLRAFHTDSRIKFDLFWLQGGLLLDPREMSLISSCGEVPLKMFSGTEFCIEKDTVFGDKKQSMLPNDTLTLRCRIRGKSTRTRELCICSVLHIVNWNIENFETSRSYKTFIEQDNILLYFSLNKKSKKGTHTIIVEVSYAERCLSFVDFTLSITDGCVRVIDKTCSFPYVKWISNIEIFPENKKRRVNIQLRSIVSLHKVCQDQLKFHSPNKIVKHENVSEAVPGSSGALACDLLLLYRESTFSDTTIKTATEGKSFSAHRSILAARSPVFRAMFEKDEMSEARSGVVDIDDLDSETVDRMLVYLYGEKLEDVQWEEASALYYAADKYDVLLLKQRCAGILKASLAVGNACDALVLADKHSDEQLAKYVVDFIRDHQEVFSSSEWEKLEERNPRLTTKIFREVYVKKGK